MRAHAPTARRGVHAVRQGRVCATDAAASGSRRALGAAVKNLQATSLSMDLAQRPRRDGASWERLECYEMMASSWRRYACGLNLDDGASRVFGSRRR